jgi:predicted O-linked N-acetylglucosamine transferase (SPINDLY family)
VTVPQILNAAVAHHRAGQFAEAERFYRQVLAVEPRNGNVLHLLGFLLHQMGNGAAGLPLLLEAVDLLPPSAQVLNNLGTVLQGQGRLADAIAACEKAIELQPDYVLAHNNLGNAWRAAGHPQRAAECYRRAIAIDPQAVSPQNNLANVLADGEQFSAAVAAHQRAIALDPRFADAHDGLGIALVHQGRVDEALTAFTRAMELTPGSPTFHDHYLTALGYQSGVSPAALLAAHDEYDRRHTAPFRAAWQPHTNHRDPERRLRLGFFSQHFTYHPVGRFLVGLLENLDQTQFQVFAYTDNGYADALTARIRKCTDTWRPIEGCGDAEFARQIRADEIDILFDLAGHTQGNRLPAFARKPAPIQITWIDSVGTTGLAAMDYILASEHLIPAAAEGSYREKVLRMRDDYVCYDPPPQAPGIMPPPASANGYVTFGSFNVLAKISAETIRLWSRILAAIPGSRLILKNSGLDDPGTAALIRDRFAECGIDAHRVELLGWTQAHEALAAYHRVDVALDPLDYNGGLTTCDALWMGLPVITCPGETFARRQGLAHLAALGLTAWVARDVDHYVALAVELSSDLPQLAGWRAQLRERVRTSPLCDAPRFARHFEALMRRVWQQWASYQ